MIGDGKGLSKPRVLLMLLSLFLTTMVTMSDMVITPIVNNLYEVFAGEPEWLIGACITGYSIVSIPAMTIAGHMCDRFNKKYVLVGGFALFAVCSIGSGTEIALSNIYVFLACRVGIGIAWGFTTPGALSIIAQFFNNENEHAKVVGWYNASLNIVGAAIAFIAGLLAVSQWTHAFFIYYAAIAVLAMLIVFLPSMPRSTLAEAGDGEDADAAAYKAPKGWWKGLVPLTLQIFALVLCNSVALYLSSVYVADAGLGDASFVGTITSIMTLVGVFGSLLFGPMYKKFKTFVYIPTAFVTAAAFIGMAFLPSAPMATICMALQGFMWPFFYCYYYTRCTEIVPQGKEGLATGVAGAAEGVSFALAAPLFTTLMSVTHAESSLVIWPWFGYLALLVAVLSLAGYLVKKGKSAQGSAE